MFERLSEKGRLFEAETRDHIKNYAEAGLRTLVVAYRVLSEEEYRQWEEEFIKAKTSVSEDRDALVDAAADKIERNLILLGATAVEDKLQKGVRSGVAFICSLLSFKCFNSFEFCTLLTGAVLLLYVLLYKPTLHLFCPNLFYVHL